LTVISIRCSFESKISNANGGGIITVFFAGGVDVAGGVVLIISVKTVDVSPEYTAGDIMTAGG